MRRRFEPCRTQPGMRAKRAPWTVRLRFESRTAHPATNGRDGRTGRRAESCLRPGRGRREHPGPSGGRRPWTSNAGTGERAGSDKGADGVARVMVRVRVTEFTDPYCTWCWGAEPLVRRLRETYRDQLAVDYVMGGLAEEFERFSDPVGGAEAGEVAPHWQAAAQQHGMPVDVSLWRDDPPSSSYPACVAYEAATFQGRERAHAFLRRMREAGLAGGENLEREGTLVDLAAAVGLDAERFRADLDGDRARAAFEADLAAAEEHDACSLPTFLVEVGETAELLRGYRPFPAFDKLFTEAGAGLVAHEPREVADLVEAYGRVAPREVAEMRGVSGDTARARLAALVDAGDVRRVDAGTGSLYEPADG